MTLDALAEAARQSKPRIEGVQFGLVENITDPERRGRVQVRIHSQHGGRDNVPTADLPWALVEQQGGGVYDVGSFNVPPVGAWVTVDFLHQHPDFPIVRGTIQGVPDNFQEVLTASGKEHPAAPVDPSKQWVTPRELETVKDIFDGKSKTDHTPTRTVWNKSIRGHTIMVEDGAEGEYIKIIDRAGQVFEMSCPTHPLTNAQNWEQRGSRDASLGTQLLHEALKDGHAHIRLVDLSGQEFVMDAQQGNEKILLRNRDKTGQITQTIEMSARRGSEFVAITDSRGDQLKFESNSDTPILIQDRTGSRIAFNVKTGQIETVGSADQSLDVAKDYLLKVGANVKRESGGSEEVTIGGKKIESVVGDTVANVMGQLSWTIGAVFSAVIANTPTQGPPAKFAWDVSTLIGGIRFAVQGPVGDIIFKTLTPASKIQLTNELVNMVMGPTGFSLTLLGFSFKVDPSGTTASMETGAAKILMTAAGVITLNNGTIPVNNFPVCAFTGAPHGNPKVLVPAGPA